MAERRGIEPCPPEGTPRCPRPRGLNQSRRLSAAILILARNRRNVKRFVPGTLILCGYPIDLLNNVSSTLVDIYA